MSGLGELFAGLYVPFERHARSIDVMEVRIGSISLCVMNQKAFLIGIWKWHFGI